ncbi:MAG TPA: hypothetical protein VGI39_39015 [Polyangiaceae bacterium]|jgi:hypothetical protein
MAGNLQLYSLLYARVNGALLTEEASVDFERDGGGNIVKTTAKGLAGVSPGSSMCSGRVMNVIPATGLEYDAGQVIVTYTPVNIGVIRSDGKQCVVNGFIMKDAHSHATDQEAKYDFSFIGTFPIWQ